MYLTGISVRFSQKCPKLLCVEKLPNFYFSWADVATKCRDFVFWFFFPLVLGYQWQKREMSFFTGWIMHCGHVSTFSPPHFVLKSSDWQLWHCARCGVLHMGGVEWEISEDQVMSFIIPTSQFASSNVHPNERLVCVGTRDCLHFGDVQPLSRTFLSYVDFTEYIFVIFSVIH